MYCDLSLTSRSGSVAVPPAAGAFRAAVWLMALADRGAECRWSKRSGGELLRATRAMECIVSCLHSEARQQVEHSSEVCTALQRRSQTGFALQRLRGGWRSPNSLQCSAVKHSQPPNHRAHIALPPCRCWDDDADSRPPPSTERPLSRSAAIRLLGWSVPRSRVAASPPLHSAISASDTNAHQSLEPHSLTRRVDAVRQAIACRTLAVEFLQRDLSTEISKRCEILVHAKSVPCVEKKSWDRVKNQRGGGAYNAKVQSLRKT